ncbi:MAG TPA: folate-binding protein [Verrucomicrobiae bacterium]|jgi:folate-binding protein YgfZ|nr:folate-binding protein [Verrucomicrobiae bacterium]
MARIARLPERSTVAVEGPDAHKFLQDLITNDLDLLKSQSAVHAGLLSPQGKVLFEFIVVQTERGFVLDTVRARAKDLVKRLTLYKLRAKIEISDRSEDQDVYAAWGEGAANVAPNAYVDPRLPELGVRIVRVKDAAIADTEDVAAYDAHRIALGVPEADKDYALGDTFPHEACLDILHGVAFDKGCFVGQEVVSRMQHRGTARKRFVIVTGAAALPPAKTEITAGEEPARAVIGVMGSSAGTSGLALVRLDRAAEMLAKGQKIKVGDVEVTLRVPAWAPYTLSASVHESEAAP